MDQNYNNSQNEFLWTLLANPANDAHLYNYNLQRLVNDFPQSGILQALLAHSSDEKNLRQASVYFNARSLYKLINAPSSFIGVSDEKIIVQNNIPSASFAPYEPQFADANDGENYFSDHTAVEIENETETVADLQPSFEHEITQHEIGGHHTVGAVPEILNNTSVEEQVENHQAEEHPTSLHEEEKHESWISEVKDEVLSHTPFEHQEASHVEEATAGLDDSNHTEEKHEGLGSELKDGVLGHVPFEQHNVSVAEETHDNTDEINNAAEEKHEGWVAEIKDEVINDLPYAGPIINYASGMGHRLPPDTEITDDVPADQSSETAANETASTTQDEVRIETPAAIHNDHTIEEPAPVQPVDEQPVNIEAAGHPEFEESPVQEHTYREVETEPILDDHIAEPENEHKQEEVASYTEESYQPEIEATSGIHNIEEETFDEITGIENIDIEHDVLGSIAATDYFTFDRAFGEHKEPEPINEPGQPVAATEAVNEGASDADQQDVSKYNDEKMPYSFLWWLDKTRKEHSGVYQPYVTPENENPVDIKAKSKRGTDELQQQYYENIFHITSIEELDKSLPPPQYVPAPPVHKLKEQVIIERFIQEEPQIRPQSSDKLDNENKAKKSSEDRDELVSETLAAIYSDQMLYHKAIASYKKLMLKFPEKSRYFAAKIEQLEKKTN